MIASAIGVLTVDHLGLLWMEHQTAGGESSIQDPTQRQGLSFAAAVADNIVSVPFKRHAGKFPPQPHIERIVKKQIREQGTNITTLSQEESFL